MNIQGGILLNFAVTPFYLIHPFDRKLVRFKGVEWRFQSMKIVAALATQGPMTKQANRALRAQHDTIAFASTANSSKQLGRALEIDVVAWNDVAYNIMLEACLAKFCQHKKARIALKATKDKSLVEHRRDPIWGDNLDGTGKNYMGKILMAVRGVL